MNEKLKRIIAVGGASLMAGSAAVTPSATPKPNRETLSTPAIQENQKKQIPQTKQKNTENQLDQTKQITQEDQEEEIPQTTQKNTANQLDQTKQITQEKQEKHIPQSEPTTAENPPKRQNIDNHIHITEYRFNIHNDNKDEALIEFLINMQLMVAALGGKPASVFWVVGCNLLYHLRDSNRYPRTLNRILKQIPEGSDLLAFLQLDLQRKSSARDVVLRRQGEKVGTTPYNSYVTIENGNNQDYDLTSQGRLLEGLAGKTVTIMDLATYMVYKAGGEHRKTVVDRKKKNTEIFHISAEPDASSDQRKDCLTEEGKILTMVLVNKMMNAQRAYQSNN